VIDMALLSVIRRWHFREGMPIREIERRTGLSRNTIRKYLRAGTVEPRFEVPERPSKLDPFAEKLSAWLRIEASRSRKQRRTARQMAIAITASVVRAGARGRYFNAVDLVTRLEEEARIGKSGALAEQLCWLDLHVLDELGYWADQQCGREGEWLPSAGGLGVRGPSA
jgi:predicted transcriptional regulator